MKEKIILFLIILFGFILRTYQASNYPPLSWDETALGYNAYSILKTGKDEYGVSFPLIFKSFGDYKPGLYVYLDIPFIAILGLNQLAVRFPSIILGSLLPLLLYFIIKHFNQKDCLLALIAAVVTATNPWNIHFSRGAWETNILLFELLLASLFFIKNKHILSAIIFGLSLYTYQSAKLISLFVIFGLLVINYKHILNYKLKFSLHFIFPLLFFSIPLFYGLVFNQNSNRLKILSVFSYPQSTQEISSIVNESSSTDYNLFHNQWIYFFRLTLSHYVNNFSPKFLLSDGDWQNPRHSPPYTGVLLFPSIIFLIIGLISLNHKYRYLNIFFITWLILVPIPAAITRDIIHSVRSLPLTIPLIYFISSGITQSLLFFKKHQRYYKPAVYAITIIYIFSLTYYLDLYYNHMVKKNPVDFLYGYHQVMDYVIANQNNYQHINISDFYGQPYIYYLFYSQYTPAKYQPQANLIATDIDTGKIKSIDKIKFGPTNLTTINQIPSSLTIITLEELRRYSLGDQTIFNNFIPLSPVGDLSTFYAYITP